MSPTEVLSASREMLIVTLLLASPFLAIAIVASLAIGLIQASTRMNDLTLSFVPRFFAVLLLLYFSATWATGQMSSYIERSAMAMRAMFQ